MASIDERVVAMAFENAKFEAGVAQTLQTLQKLDTAVKTIGSTSGLSKIEAESQKITLTAPMTALDKLKAKLGLTTSGTTFTDMEASSHKVTLDAPMTALDKLNQKLGTTNAGTTFTDMEKAANGVNFTGLTTAIDGISTHFTAMQGIALGVFGTIGAKAATMGAGLAKSLSLGPISQGFEEYTTNLQSIQTILANTQQSGATLDDVNATLQELNTYSDQTIYNFSQMANAIGKFTAAGVDLDTSAASIKGIANLAALSGSSAEQASTAYTQLSQAIASGKVGLQDWNSVVNAGMGGSAFQRALAMNAEKMGTLAKGAVDLKGKMKNVSIEGQSFRESITAKPGEQSWLTSKVLTQTLQQFTGDMTDAQLAAQGFNEQEIKAIQQTARTAKNAATEVKNIKQVFDVAKESIGSGWSETFKLIFGNFEEAKKTFTGMSNFLGEMISANADARNKVLESWRSLGGRDELISGIKTGFGNLLKILGAVKDAFREIFPAQTGQDLFNLTKGFSDLMEKLTPSPKLLDQIQRIFAGLFAVMDIGWTIVKRVGEVIFDLLGVVGDGSGGFVEFVASIGDFLVSLDKAISKGDSLKGIFESFGTVLAVPIELVKELATALFGMFGGADSKKADEVAGSLDKLDQALRPLRNTLQVVKDGWEKFLGILSRVREAIEPAFTKVVDFLGKVGDMVVNAFKSINWDTALHALETGLIAGIFLKLKEFLSGGGKLEVGGGFFDKINDTLGALTTNLEAMQRNLQANTLLQIAIAIGILAAGILVLSTIPSDKLSTAMSAIAVGLGQLIVAMALLNKAAGGAAFAKMPFIAGSMILLSVAVLILAGAMKVMATMSWEEIAKGLVGVGGVLAAVGVAIQLINPGKMLAAGLAMIPLAIGINLLAVATKIFASMSWEELGKGLAGVVVALLGIAMAMSVMPANILLTAAGVTVLGIGLILLATAVASFGNMELKTMVQGLLGIAGALVVIGLAISFIPPTIALTAAGLILVGIALTTIAAAVAIFGNLDLLTLAKGIGGIAAMLVVLGIGLIAMQGTLGGSVALLAAAAALAILAPTLAFMGTLKWSTIFKGLAAIALSLGTIAIVGVVAAPALIAIGAALAVLGLGLLAVGAAVYLFSKGLSLLGSEGITAVAKLVAAFGAFILIFPKMVIDFVKGLVAIVAEVAKLAPAIAQSLVKIATTLLDAIIDLSPKIAEAIAALAVLIAQVLAENVPVLAEAAMKLLLAFLTTIRNNMPKIIELAADIVVNFVKGLGDNAPRIVKAGVDAIAKFADGIVKNLDSIVTSVAKMITKFLDSVTKHLPQIVKSGANLIVTFLKQIAKAVPRFVEAATDVIIGFLDGIEKAIPRIRRKALSLARTFLENLKEGLLGLIDIGFDTVIDFLHGIAKAIRENTDDLYEAGLDIADALLDGVMNVFGKMAWPLKKALEAVFSLLPGWAKKLLGIHSPSTVFAEIGKFTMLGFIEGMQDSRPEMEQAMKRGAQGVIEAAKSAFSDIPDTLEGLIDMEPVIKPVLDLTSVEADAKKIGDLADVVPISAAASFDQASAISTDQQTAQDAAQQDQAGTTFEFNQYNTSPESLSEIEIYRQTKNQLGQVKTALGLPT